MLSKLKQKLVNLFRRERVTVRKVNLDDLSEDEKQDVYKTASEITQLDFYQGRVEHAYAIDTVDTPDFCPRCQAPTQQYYANFIYATQTAPRVMFTPAGQFCTACPTVVVDEGLIRKGVSRPFTYQGVLGFDHPDREHPDLLKTWNGAKTVYILDEDKTAIGLATTDQVRPTSPAKAKRSTNRRKKMAKASRKQNRRKR